MGICNGKSSNLDINHYDSLLSINEYENIPIVPLEQAVESLISILPTIQTYVQLVKQKCANPIDGLTSDRSASIMLYSMVWQPIDQCLYTILNSTLQSLNEVKLTPWFLYLKLLFTSLLQLPSNQLTVYRGSKSDLSKHYQINENIIWWDLSLCTTSIEDLQSESCLEKTEIRTMFTIRGYTIKDIHRYSYFQLDNSVVFLPVTKFKVVELYYQHDNLCVITLEEIESSFLLHSFDETRSNLDSQLSSNILKRFCKSFKKFDNQSITSNTYYRNPSLEHHIIESGHRWTVDLDGQNLNDQDMKIVVKYAIIKNRCKRIRLRNNNITSQGTLILADGLYNNTTLESLDLRHNQISDLGVQYLALAIVHSNMKTLNLESNDITPEGAQYLAEILKHSRTLTELYLSKNHLGDRGVELLADALSENTTNLQGQSNTGVCMSTQSTLQHLYLGQNDITDEGIKSLSNMLETNRTLTWLWLTGNEISNNGVEFLSNTLADYNITLEWLFLNSNKLISDPSVDALIHMLKRNNSLKTIYINNCNLSEISKRTLLRMIKTKKDFDLEV